MTHVMKCVTDLIRCSGGAGSPEHRLPWSVIVSSCTCGSLAPAAQYCFVIISVECGAVECGANFQAVYMCCT